MSGHSRWSQINHKTKMVQPGSISWMFGSPVQVDQQIQNKLDKLIEALDDQDDVEDVVINLQLPI